MAGSPPKPPPPTLAAGSSSPKPAPPTFSHPSDGQLIVHYLRPRVVSGSGTKEGFIHEADLYSADPYQLTGKYSPVTAGSGERAWYFFTPLHPVSSAKPRIKKRTVDNGREGAWVSGGGSRKDVMFNGQRVGRRRGFSFEEMVDGKSVKTSWRMTEFLLDPYEGRPEAGSSDHLALSNVYRFPMQIAKAEDESSMAVAKADGEAPAEPAVVTPGIKAADEEIGEETAAGPGRKRKASDMDSGAETVASSPGRQNKADGEIESADAATTGEIFADSKDALDAAEKAEPAQGQPILRLLP